MSIDLHFLRAVAGFTLDIKTTLPGQGLIAVTGASGSGKTTLLRLIAGLDKADKGRISVNKVVWQCEDYCLSTRQRQVGYLSQTPTLFPHLTAQQNIDYAIKRRQQKHCLYHNDIADLLDISHCLKRYPKALSGGEKQRVALATMLAATPKIMLLDEAFTGIEREKRFFIIKQLKAIAGAAKIPVFYVTHTQEEVKQFADTTVNLLAGRISPAAPAPDTPLNGKIHRINAVDQQLHIIFQLADIDNKKLFTVGDEIQLLKPANQ